MIIKMFTFGMYLANCYLVACNETKEAAIIDPTFDNDVECRSILRVVDQLGLHVKLIINTHGHPDHTAGNGILKDATGAPILIHEDDAPMVTRLAKRMSGLFGLRATSPPPSKMLHDGDVLLLGRCKLQILHTPGHTKGGISIYVDDVVFTGDTLFAGSIGRTDFPGGSFKEIIHSIKTKLLTLPDSVKVYSGHGPASTIGEEKRNNPFLQN